MKRVWPVAKREFLAQVRSKAFVIATVVAPVFVTGVFFMPALMLRKQRGGPLRVAVLDASGVLQGSVEESLARQRPDGQPRFAVQPTPGTPDAAIPELRKDVLAGRLDGYLYLPPDVLDRSSAEYYGRNVTNTLDMRLLDRAVEEAVVSRRLASAGFDAVRVRDLTRPLDLKTIRLSESGDRVDRGTTAMFSIILMMMLYITVLMWGQALLSGVIEEKSSRVVEVVVSSLSPFHLFAGKLLGVGSAGLLQFLVWSLSLLALGTLGAGTMAFLGGRALPEVTPLLAISFIVYFLLGYFLYAALFAAVGAAVNTPQEAQGLVFPVMMPLIAAMVLFPAVLQSPNSTLSTTLSLIPLLTPLLMFLRITILTPPAWQILLSLALTLLTIVTVTWGASRIYRVGILMYGKRPTFPEMLRWARHR